MKNRIIIFYLLISAIFPAIFNQNPCKGQDKPIWVINFRDANTRPTYNTFHHINEAWKLATGKGIKVGILGKYFGYNTNRDLYAGGKNFTGDNEAFEEIAEHGLWMATTLKEIAPDVEIYALNARDKDRENETKAIIDAIDWAIENNIDILTYSAEAFQPENRKAIDQAVQKAIKHGIVTTFIHYDLPENILPTGLFASSPKSYAREADLNVFHFDYNVLLLFVYERYLKSGGDVGNRIGDMPYFSNSSMSPVLAGIVAMMKEIDNNRTPAEYKDILVKTSREITYNGYKVKHVVDAPAAIDYLKNLNQPEK